jgi:signal peptidase II
VLSAVVAAITVLLDQVTKNAVARNLGLCERVPVLGSILRLTHIRNSGAVFGMMRGAGAYFTFFSVVAAVVLIAVLFFSRRASMLVRISLGLVLGGAVGNLIDRLRFGAVVDFIDIGIGETARWPCFNVADTAITVGVILLVLNSLKRSVHRVTE